MAAASKEQLPEEMRPRDADDGNGYASMVYAAAKRVAIVGAIYLVGYMNWSVAWLITPVVFSLMRDQWKRTSDARRSISIASALANEKDVILAKITDLPSWVYFPDVERCEWVNRVSNSNFVICDVIMCWFCVSLMRVIREYRSNKHVRYHFHINKI